MQTTTFEAPSDIQSTYPECICETKSSTRTQALLWAIIAIAFFAIYYHQPPANSILNIIQIFLIATCACLAIIKLLSSSRLIYIPTGSVVKKQSYNFSSSLKADILHCLEEGNTARLKALKNDDAGGLLVEFIESQDHLFIAARLLKYEPHGYVAKTDWITMKR